MNPTEIEKAIALQPGILGQDWSSRLDAKTRKIIKSAESITFIGTGTSFHCALWATWLAKLASHNKLEASAISTWDFLVNQSHRSTPKSRLFVVISHRGNKSLTKRVLDELKTRKHVLVAGEGAPSASHPLIETSPQETSNAHTMSLIGAMAAASEIIAAMLPRTAAHDLRNEREMAAALLLSIEHDRNELGNALGGLVTRGSGLHFVGGGPFHAIALELALKAREIIHLPALGYNIEEYLHGPLASVEEEDTLVPLGTTTKRFSTPIDRLLYGSRLEACRLATEAVGALVVEPAWDKPIAATAAKLNLAWQALLPLVWGQILCVSTAQSWDINPDLNRCDDLRYEEAKKRSEL